MGALAVAAVLGSAASAYLLGFAFQAPRHSFWRSKRGIWALVLVSVSMLTLPPQVVALGSSMSVMSVAGTAVEGFTLPQGFNTGVYLAAWLVTSVLGFLAGIRIWKAGQPGWREGSSKAYDASGVSRVNAMLPMADTLPDALDVIARAGLSERDAERAAADIREAGRRFANALPPSDGAAWSLVASKIPGAVAGKVTGYLLEGAGRRGAGRASAEG
ncbi:MAG: hypothetical protein EG823_04810 [Actinobacteria bacterium]|nr:hypothetical protein [Actinomycetota bacterium]